MNLKITSRIHNALIVLPIVFLWACSSSNVQQNLSADERFESGKKKFDNGDYLEAISEFETIRLQFPGSGVADKAQFYLGDCRFKQEEYLLAAEEYQTLKRNMPASPLVSEAQYKIALCYYSLAPTSPLDQSYTLRAIDEFQTFVEYYSKHERVPDAEEKIKELNTRLAKKLFDSAQLYMKMEYYKAASIYFGSVVEKYHDTPYAEPALLGKVKALVARKKYDEAKPEIEKFLERYPNSSQRTEAENLRQDINDHVKSHSAAIVPGHIEYFSAFS
ncbi:MAG: outer membrane protein assembly factor BamD [Ignavibacteriae bacterium]|nr:outer membrane protein assembly factor BamD [Ignavibacteriota bacterium]